MNQSNLFSLNTRDAVNSLVMAILTPVVYLIQHTVETGSLTFDWKAIGVAAVAGAVGYLVKNFFTPKADASK